MTSRPWRWRHYIYSKHREPFTDRDYVTYERTHLPSSKTLFLKFLVKDFNLCFTKRYTTGYLQYCTVFFKLCYSGLVIVAPVFMGSVLVLIGLVTCWRWLWRTWRLRLCLCGISLSGVGGGFVVLLDVLYKVGCILAWDVAPSVRILQDKYNVVWVPFPFYGGMREIGHGLLAVVRESDLALRPLHELKFLQSSAHIWIYNVVQVWPGLFVCKSGDISPGHIWNTLYIHYALIIFYMMLTYESKNNTNTRLTAFIYVWRIDYL